MHKKTTILALTVIMMTVSGAALTTNFTEKETEIQPGGNATVGTINFTTGANESINISRFYTTGYPYSVSYSPPASFTVGENSTQSVAVVVEAPQSANPGSLEGSTTATFSNQTSRSWDWEATVLENKSWKINNVESLDTVSLGTENNYTTISLGSTGNVRTEIEAETTGNITEFLYHPESVYLYPGDNASVRLEYRVPSSTAPGFYNGTVNLTGGGKSRLVNFSTLFKDTTPPEINEIGWDNVMATQDLSVYVEPFDNVNVTSVSANVTRQVSVMVDNESVTVNKTVGGVDFGKEELGLWTGSFEDTEEIGQYHADLTVVDSSNLSVSETIGFNVEGLNATHVLNSNFKFEAVKPDENAVKKIITNDVDTPVNLSLETFSHSGNSTITVGVRREGEEASDSLYTENGGEQTVEISDAGTYELVVKSDSVETFSGKVDVKPVPQHYEVSDILFEGQVVDPVYPEPSSFEIGEFSGKIEFVNNESAVHQRVRFTGSADARDCRGVDTWSQCISGFSLGEIPELKQENQRLKDDWGWGKPAFLLALFGWFTTALLGLLIGWLYPQHYAARLRDTEDRLG